MPNNTLSPTGLTPQQQLDAANLQFKNQINQLVANGTGPITTSDVLAAKTAILNSGAYPALDLGSFGVSQTYNQTLLDVNGNPVDTLPEFYVVGDANSGIISPIRGGNWNGTPLLNNNGTVVTADNAEQVAAAQQAYESAQILSSKLATENSAADAKRAQDALTAAKARLEALQAQSQNTPAADTTVTSSPEAQAASSAKNQQTGQEITGVTTQNIDTTAAVAAAKADTNAAQQEQLQQQQQKIESTNDTNSAQSSGGGSDVTTQTQISNAQNFNRDRLADATPVTRGLSGTNNSAAEDNPQNGATTAATDNPVYTDQQKSAMMGRGLPSTNPSGTDATTNGSNSVSITKQGTATNDDTSSANPNKNSASPTSSTSSRPNKLHNYVNYTYRLSLYAIPRETVNAIFASDTTPTNQSILNNSVWICSDSGQGGNTRNDNFPVDLTIDNLELDTIVNSNNSRTRATDVIKLKFDIIEPYTVNFLGRLMKLSATVNPNGNWSTMFFVLKIEFAGYTDNGQPIIPSSGGDTIPNTTKFIPFTMLNMKFNVSGSGGKYSIDAIPVNALALTALDNQIPFHVEVSGITINDIFNGDLSSTTDVVSGSGRTNQEKQVFTTQQNTVNGGNTTVKKGLSQALNANEEQKVAQKTQKKPNTYKFDFDNLIKSASVVDPAGYFKIQGVPGTSGKDANEIKQGKVGSLVADLKSGVFRANPGTRITDFINSVLSVSTYMTSQHNTSGDNSGAPIWTWKITPVVQFNDIDESTNFYARDVTYVVKPYLTYGQDAPNFGQARVEQNRIVKTYKYIYSGNNQDVLDANIDFQMAFFELKNGVPYNYLDRDGQTPGQAQSQTANQAPSTIKKFFMPRYAYTNGLANRQNTGPTTVDLATIGVQELMEKLFDNRGDMISLDITIVGDPDWISQDYPLMHPSLVGSGSYLQNGSINFSNTVYFNFYFATPNTDYNDTTGLFDDKNNYSEFSGIYQVISVKSNFTNGKFTQKLSNFRVRNQDTVQTTAIRTDTAAQTAGGSGNYLTQLTTNPKAEKATTSLVIPNDPRLSIAAGTNTGSTNNQPTYNITDPRVGLVTPKNTWNEDTGT
jgi:hypothetical protein